jgi:hypothetical protein
MEKKEIITTWYTIEQHEEIIILKQNDEFYSCIEEKISTRKFKNMKIDYIVDEHEEFFIDVYISKEEILKCWRFPKDIPDELRQKALSLI